MVQFACELELDVKVLEPNDLILLKDFDCGNPSINEFFLNSCDNLNVVTYLWLETVSQQPVCLYSLSCSGLMLHTTADKIQIHPAVEIQMFAVNKPYMKLRYDNSTQNTLSQMFVSNMIEEIRKFTDEICGARYIVLYSVPKAFNFWKSKCNFSEFTELMHPNQSPYLDDCTPFFYNMCC
ncbi:MAG: hypothetical protein VB100_14415 [Angelakisella sp.]|nr:hypothetical protein [Angelakisella sp.]